MPHPKSNNWIGFIISTSEVSIYHSGDTDLIPEMNDLKADIALLPVSGTYVMNVRHAICGLKLLNQKLQYQCIMMLHYQSIIKYFQELVIRMMQKNLVRV